MNSVGFIYIHYCFSYSLSFSWIYMSWTVGIYLLFLTLKIYQPSNQLWLTIKLCFRLELAWIMNPRMGKCVQMILFWSFKGQHHTTKETGLIFAVSTLGVSVPEELNALIGMKCQRLGSCHNKILKIVIMGMCLSKLLPALVVYFFNIISPSPLLSPAPPP